MLEKWIGEQFNLRPAAIIKTLNLKQPIDFNTAAYGHFDNPKATPSWEILDEEILKSAETL